jgi:hypothetical protein
MKFNFEIYSRKLTDPEGAGSLLNTAGLELRQDVVNADMTKI